MMTLTITVALLVCLLGALVYLLLSPAPRKPLIAEMGRIAFFVGLLWLVYYVGATRALHF